MSEPLVCVGDIDDPHKSVPIGATIPAYLREYARSKGICVSKFVREALEAEFLKEHGYIPVKPSPGCSSHDHDAGVDRSICNSIGLLRRGRTKLDAFKRRVVRGAPKCLTPYAARKKAVRAICDAIQSETIVLYTDRDRRHKGDAEYYYVAIPTAEHPKTTVEDYERIVSNTPKKVKM